jgi:Flp pilus assembly protein TadD
MYNGKSQLASDQLHHATSLNPTGIPAWESLAALQLNCGEIVEAAETYEKLVSPQNAIPGIPHGLLVSGTGAQADRTDPTHAYHL